MRSLHFAVDSKRSAKQQALDLIPQLQQAIPLERAPMRLRITLSSGGGGGGGGRRRVEDDDDDGDEQKKDAELRRILDDVQVRGERREADCLLSGASIACFAFFSPLLFSQAVIEQQSRPSPSSTGIVVVCQVPPSSFRILNDRAKGRGGGGGDVGGENEGGDDDDDGDNKEEEEEQEEETRRRRRRKKDKPKAKRKAKSAGRVDDDRDDINGDNSREERGGTALRNSSSSSSSQSGTLRIDRVEVVDFAGEDGWMDTTIQCR